MACEISKDLSEIVKTKCRFLNYNFLQVTSEEVSHLDYIIMNPPFTADEKHILHAWSIAPDGCTIISLSNLQTIENKSSNWRQNLSYVISQNGKYENLGDCFSNSERKTNVEVAMVTLYKPGSKDGFGDYFDMGDDEYEHQENGIISYNAVRDVVQRYVEACKLYDTVLENAVKMNEMAGVFGVDNITFSCKVKDVPIKRAEFIKGLQKKAWNWIFDKMNMGKFMTQKLREDINRFVEVQVNVPFTMKNIYKMIELVIGTHGQRMDKSLIDIFDRLTEHYDENRYHVEGWKTNSHYLVNKKFILPWVTESDFNGKMRMKWSGNNVDIFNDFVKGLRYLRGESTEMENLYSYVERLKKEGGIHFGKWFNYYDLFEIKGYKKGTIHCKFKDDNLWALFNRKVAEIKGYLLPEKL
jgi:hypothetical protein